MSASFYVYALLDPRKDGQPFYIGKGSGQRAKSTIDLAYRQPFKSAIITKIRDAGMEPEVEIVANGLTEGEAFLLETRLILHYGRRGIDGDGVLANRSIGGNAGKAGYRLTPEQRARCSAAQKGHTVSEAARRNQSEAQHRRFQSDAERRKSSMRKTPADVIGRRIVEARRRRIDSLSPEEREIKTMAHSERALAQALGATEAERAQRSKKMLEARWAGRDRYEALGLLDRLGSIQAVADHLGISYGAAKVRIQRAKKRLPAASRAADDLAA